MRLLLSLALATIFSATASVAQELGVMGATGQTIGSKIFTKGVRTPGVAVVTSPQQLSEFIHASTAAGTLNRFAVIDLREQNVFEASHIHGAINWPITDNPTSIQAAVEAINAGRIPDNVRAVVGQGKTLVFHCQQSANRTPRIASVFANKYGSVTEKVGILNGGYDAFERYDATQQPSQRLTLVGGAARVDAQARPGAEEHEGAGRGGQGPSRPPGGAAAEGEVAERPLVRGGGHVSTGSAGEEGAGRVVQPVHEGSPRPVSVHEGASKPVSHVSPPTSPKGKGVIIEHPMKPLSPKPKPFFEMKPIMLPRKRGVKVVARRFRA